MKILAVDTSSDVAAVAVMEDMKILGETILNHKKTHSQKLMPVMEGLLRNLEMKPMDIDIYAVSIGPGSFTGLRIGVTTIKALAYAAGKPVVGVPSLDALAYNIPLSEGLICPMMDARNRQVYTALYKYKQGTLLKLTEDMGITLEELAEIIKKMNEKVVILGDGAQVHGEWMKEALKEQCEIAPCHLMLQRASSVAFAAREKAIKGEVEDSFQMTPFYLRKSQAEREYEKRHKLI